MIDVSEVAVMLLVMFGLGMWTMRLLDRSGVLLELRHRWHSRGR